MVHSVQRILDHLLHRVRHSGCRVEVPGGLTKWVLISVLLNLFEQRDLLEDYKRLLAVDFYGIMYVCVYVCSSISLVLPSAPS